MGDIAAQNENGLTHERYHVLGETLIGSTELGVDLETEVGAVLLLWHANVVPLYTLRSNAERRVGDAFDARVKGDTSVRKNTDQQLWQTLGLVFCLQEGFFAYLLINAQEVGIDISMRVTVLDRGMLVGDVHACVCAGHNEFLNKPSDERLGAVSLCAKDDDAPELESPTIGDLHTPKIPGTIARDKVGILRLAMVADGGCRKGTGGDLNHFVGDLHTKVLEELVIVITEDLETILNFVKACLRRLAGEPDHVGHLDAIKLPQVPLTLKDEAQLDRQGDGVACFDAR